MDFLNISKIVISIQNLAYKLLGRWFRKINLLKSLISEITEAKNAINSISLELVKFQNNHMLKNKLPFSQLVSTIYQANISNLTASIESNLISLLKSCYVEINDIRELVLDYNTKHDELYRCIVWNKISTNEIESLDFSTLSSYPKLAETYKLYKESLTLLKSKIPQTLINIESSLLKISTLSKLGTACN